MKKTVLFSLAVAFVLAFGGLAQARVTADGSGEGAAVSQEGSKPAKKKKKKVEKKKKNTEEKKAKKKKKSAPQE